MACLLLDTPWLDITSPSASSPHFQTSYSQTNHGNQMAVSESHNAFITNIPVV